jgi:hypothetical protein
MKVFDVYSDEDNWYFSEGVSRDFGSNKLILLTDGTSILRTVQPLKCIPDQCGLIKVGTINVTRGE